MYRHLHSRIAVVVAVVAMGANVARAQNVPRSVPFNGQVVTTKADAPTGPVTITFALYTDQTGGAPLWTERQLVTLDRDGRYSVILGSATVEGLPVEAFAGGTAKWLGVQIDGAPEQPRFMLLSVPYALKAGDADTVNGKTISEFVTTSQLSDSVKSVIKESTATAKGSPSAPSAPLTTPNALVKYADSNGNTTESALVDSSGRLGIGIAPNQVGAEIDMQGSGSTTTLTMRNSGKVADVLRMVGSDGSVRFGSATTANLFNLVGPAVGIGTTAPVGRLDVAGTGEPAIVIEHTGTTGNPKLSFYQDGQWTSSVFWDRATNSLNMSASNGHPPGMTLTSAGNVGMPGNVGIGMDPGASRVSVSGNVLVQDGNVGLGQPPGGPTGPRLGVNGQVSVGLYPLPQLFGMLSVASGVWGIDAYCGAANCIGISGRTEAYGLAGGFSGGWGGVSASSSTAGGEALRGQGEGNGSYGAFISSGAYRGAHIETAASNEYALYVVGSAYVSGSTEVAGNLVVGGSKTGYVVDIMQNADLQGLESGDVVVIGGSGAPVLGEIPVVSIRKAAKAYDTGVAGIVDQVFYVPDAATRAAYGAQEKAIESARDARANAWIAGLRGAKTTPGDIRIPPATISDADGSVHALPNETVVASGGYCSVVTLGAYKLVKVDATSGAIHAGDLLTTSSNPGYAMKVTDKVAAIGAIIGKALGALETGTGAIPIMVMPN